MTITISWWIAPAIITIIAFGWAFVVPSGGTMDFMPMVRLLFAGVVSLAAWLLCSLL